MNYRSYFQYLLFFSSSFILFSVTSCQETPLEHITRGTFSVPPVTLVHQHFSPKIQQGKNIYELVLMNEPLNPTMGEAKFQELGKDVNIPKGMTFIKGGEVMVREESMLMVDGFLADAQAVTVKEFGRFVNETGYTTTAEIAGYSWSYQVQAGKWMKKRGVYWGHGKPNSPVVHVSAHDAEAYCQWAKKRLPTHVERLRIENIQEIEGDNYAAFGYNWFVTDEQLSLFHDPVGEGKAMFSEWTGTWITNSAIHQTQQLPDAQTLRLISTSGQEAKDGIEISGILPEESSNLVGFRCVKDIL